MTHRKTPIHAVGNIKMRPKCKSKKTFEVLMLADDWGKVTCPACTALCLKELEKLDGH